MSADIICPGCGTAVPGLDLVGYEDPRIYDGVLIWTDNRCGHSWPRFSETDRRYGAALSVMRSWKESVGRG